jgi:hypothetical protein
LRQADDLLRTIGELNAQLRAAERDAADAEASEDSSTSARARFLAGRLAEARRDYEEVAIRVKEIGSPATTLLGADRPRARAMLEHLRGDEALLEYQTAGDSLLIFVGRRNAVQAVSVPLPHGGLAPRVRLARALIGVREDTSRRAAPVLGFLHALLIDPARRTGALAGMRTLVIVPHGVLSYLPFAALLDSVTGKYLVEDFGLLTLPSASSLGALRGRRDSSAAGVIPAVFAPDPNGLPGTGAEARVVGRALPGAVVHIGGEASESVTRDALAAGALVHLASHGELNARNPMFSWVQTASGRRAEPTQDGRLEVHEILGLRVRSPLVFLSGCETGLGTAGSTGFSPGEDFATLARAFLYAGARNVVATLWRVDDQGAGAFAAEYYRRLSSEGPVAALAGAQRSLAQDRKFAAPYYWAGYTLAGDGEPVTGAKALKLSVNP